MGDAMAALAVVRGIIVVDGGRANMLL